jgi:hypothetical protein
MVPAAVGVTVAVPFSDLLPAQPSPDCPPLATQVAAFAELQIKVTGSPTLTEDGVADNVTAGKVTAGKVTTTVTEAPALTPCAMQFSRYW